MTKMFLPPKERTILLPSGGWKERTFYVVMVAWKATNPVHKAMFYTGFLNGQNGGPGGYNVVWSPTYEQVYPQWLGAELKAGSPGHTEAEWHRAWSERHPHSIDKVHYLKVLSEVTEMVEED